MKLIKALSVFLLLLFLTVPAIAGSSKQFSEAQICLAALIQEFAWTERPTGGQSKIGNLTAKKGNDYIFKSSKGTYKCKVQGPRIVWANYNGRWRDTKSDSYLTYRIEGDKLTINSRYEDGSSTEKTYSKSLLARHAK